MTGRTQIMRWIELPWLDRDRLALYPPMLLAGYLLYLAVWLARTLAHGLIDPSGGPLGCDFIEFWTAARMALDHAAPAIYDFAKFYDAQKLVIAAVPPLFPWHYPPILLLFLLPFGFLPYLWALPLWFAAGIAAYLSLLQRLAVRRSLLWIGLVFPGAILTLHLGQNDLLLAAALGWGLLLLDERPLLAGLLLASLAVKPQLAPLVPLALLVSGRWTAFAAAASGVLLLIGLSWLAFGSDLWQAFFSDMRLFGRGNVLLDPANVFGTYASGFIPWDWSPSSFVAARSLGLGLPVAASIQGATALGAAATVVWAWRGSASMALKSALLVTASLLVSPYIFNYDLIVLILPIAWLGWHGVRQGFLPGEKLALLIAWLAPMLIMPLAVTIGFQPGALLIAGFLWVLCRRIAFERRAVEHPVLA